MRITLNLLLVCCFFCLTNAVQAQTPVYDNYVGSSGNTGNSEAYFICTGYLTPQQVPFAAMLNKYNYFITASKKVNGLTEYYIGPIANGGEAELVLQDIRKSGFEGARFGNPYAQEAIRPTAPGQQPNMYNTPPSNNTPKPLDQRDMRVYGGSSAAPNKTISTPVTNYSTSGIMFTPPPVHNFNEIRQNEALRQLTISLGTPTGLENNATEPLSNSAPVARSIQEESRATSPIDKGALMNVYFVQVAALSDENASPFESLSANYNVYLQEIGTLHKVIVGPFYAESDAERHRQIIANSGYKDSFLRPEAYFQNNPDIIVSKKTQEKLDMHLIYPKR